MNELFSSGQVIDLVIAVFALEALVVRGVMQRRRALPWPTLMAGLGLVLAWRMAHAGAGWVWVALPLCAAAMAHGLDMWRRWSEP